MAAINSFFKTIRDGLDGLVFPPRCEVCSALLEHSGQLFCGDCWTDLQRAMSSDYCRRCGQVASPYGIVNGRCGGCQDTELSYDGLVRVGVYEGVLRSIILSFKFHEKTEFSAPLGGWLRDALSVCPWRSEIDFFVPVPLHWRRWLERGYNQAALLARQICYKPAAVCCDLARIRYTRRQWQLTEHQRRRNVKGAFAVRKGHPFSGKTICLVDDISTTGATLEECAAVLKAVGAVRVYAVVAAVGKIGLE